MDAIIPAYPAPGSDHPSHDDLVKKRREIDQKLIDAERSCIDQRRANFEAADGSERESPQGDGNALYGGQGLAGLALSGGGIRSSTFCLGILQFLARRRLLKHLDYMSTVSGGGYIGSSLTWLFHGDHRLGSFDADAQFPYGTNSPKPDQPIDANERLAYLRSHGMYLTPGNGITLLSGIAVVLRGLLLNLVVWVPIVSAVMAAVVGLIGLLRHHFLSLGAKVCAQPAKSLIAVFFDCTKGVPPPTEVEHSFAFFMAWMLVLAGGITFFLMACIYYSLRTATYALGGQKWTDEDRYRMRRKFEHWAGVLLMWGVALPAVLVSLPMTHQWVQVNGALALITGGGASGIWSFLTSKSSSDEPPVVPPALVASIGAALLLYGIALLCFSIGISTVTIGSCWAWVGLMVAVSVAVGTGFWVNINLIGLHRFYRDRLMEAFMPDADTAANFMAVPADRGMVNSMASGPDGKPLGPYHLVNTNLILVETRDRERRLRGGDNFVISPLYCGSSATGWCNSKDYLHGSMSLATAMAISGAAANPNAACGGVGATRSIPIAMLMSLLNIRLGYFVPNPSKDAGKSKWWNKRAHHFEPGLTAAISAITRYGDDEERSWLQLSDGGHFDNTGLYELFRRRVKLIIACDGSADADYIFSDLILALERARMDFGITWQTHAETPLEKMVPRKRMGFPRRARRSQFGYAVLSFKYPGDDVPGLILYMTTTMIEKLDEVICGYKAANPQFPDQSTADQFFDDRQFEAYRVLGWCVAEQMAQGTDIHKVLANGKVRIVVPRAVTPSTT